MNESQLTEEDRSLAVLAHLSGYAGYLFPCGGVLAPLILLSTAKSKTVVAIAKQALVLNVFGFLMLLVLGAGATFLSLLVGKWPLVMYAVMIVGGGFGVVVLGLILVCPVIGAIKASQGEYFRYPVFGISAP